jgi:antirestriction protein ArdC
MKTGRFDIHQHITGKIVSAIERGAGDFRLPWHRSAGNIMRPVNVASKKAYRGINVLVLWATGDEKGVDIMRNVLDAFYSVWTATHKEAEAKATANVQGAAS